MYIPRIKKKTINFLYFSIRLAVKYNRTTVMDRQTTTKRQLQVVFKKITKKEKRVKKERERFKKRTKDIRNKTHSNCKCPPSPRVHQSKEWGEPGCQTAAEIPVAAEPSTSVRSDARWTRAWVRGTYYFEIILCRPGLNKVRVNN